MLHYQPYSQEQGYCTCPNACASPCADKCYTNTYTAIHAYKNIELEEVNGCTRTLVLLDNAH